jgi:hypothetical protein
MKAALESAFAVFIVIIGLASTAAIMIQVDPVHVVHVRGSV